MRVYEYKYLDIKGEEKKSTYKGSEEELRDKLSREKIYLISLKEKNNIHLFKENLTYKNMYIICKILYVQIKSGNKIEEAIKTIRDMNISKNINKIFSNAYRKILSGESLKEAFKEEDLPLDFVYMLKVGEEGGSLEEVLKELSEIYKYKWKSRKEILSKLTYPMFIVLMCNIVFYIFMISIIPKFQHLTISNGDFIVTLIFNLSRFIIDNKIISITLNIILYIMAYKSIKGSVVKRLPFIKSYVNKYHTLMFFKTFNILYKNGVNYLDILEVCHEVSNNKTFAEGVKRIRDNINEGHGLSESFIFSNIFSQTTTSIISKGEECGEIEKALELICSLYEEEIKDMLDKLIKLMEPIIILVMATFIGIFLIKIILPLMNSIYKF
ncbi:type II secretion system F family protein [Clostridium sp.]|uniref:type II secretion system F family protein n=1 Tax=Clostridium sp. TaxID=1506 RepID=UPI003463D917